MWCRNPQAGGGKVAWGVGVEGCHRTDGDAAPINRAAGMIGAYYAEHTHCTDDGEHPLWEAVKIMRQLGIGITPLVMAAKPAGGESAGAGHDRRC